MEHDNMATIVCRSAGIPAQLPCRAGSDIHTSVSCKFIWKKDYIFQKKLWKQVANDNMAMIVCRSAGIPAQLPCRAGSDIKTSVSCKVAWKKNIIQKIVKTLGLSDIHTSISCKFIWKKKDYRKKSWKCLVRPILTLPFPAMLFEKI